MNSYMMWFQKEAERRRIRAIINQLRAVNSSLNSLNNSCSSAKSTLQSNTLIDDRPYKGEKVDEIKSTVSGASSSISSIINTLYSLMSQI